MDEKLYKTLDWKYIGAKLARETDKEQSDFFKGFVQECNSWGTNYEVQKQLSFINQKLTKDERETLSMISFID